MRIVPLVLAVLTSAGAVFGQETVTVRAGHNREALKLGNQGTAQLKKGDFENAKRSFDQAIQLDPTMWPAYYSRSRVFFHRHQWKAVIRDTTTALRRAPNFADCILLRGAANQYLGNHRAGLADFDKVIRIHPPGGKYALALNSAAWIRATCPDASLRNGKIALRQAKTACKATAWKEANSIDTLAAAYAETRDFDSAVRYQAIAMKTSKLPGELARDTEQHLAAYKQHRPWRDTQNK